MVIAEEESTQVKEATHDIDLKCAEKVADSDNEENMESTEAKTKKLTSQTVTVTLTTSSGENQDALQNVGANRDFTCKPKPIKAQRQTIDSALHSYQQIPMYAFNSPKNPTGIPPFQTTGMLFWINSIEC